jgi:hypothetical protein
MHERGLTMTDHDARDTTEQDAILAEAKKLDDAARKKNESDEHDARVRAARTVFAEGEVGPDGTAARRLAHPGEVTDALGNPDPFGTHVNRGTAFDPIIVPIADLAPSEAHNLGLPTGQRAPVSTDDGPAAPDDVRDDAPVAKAPAKK